MKFLSLFSGVGGMDLGFERAGMKCIGQVEKDDWRRDILSKIWPNVPKWEDIRDFTGGEIGSVELICGGYPCQGELLSGFRLGERDHRWLWPEMLRIIKVKRPTWVVGENVINHEGLGLKTVVSDLEAAGYQVRPFIIPSAACGLPTVERHIWIIATSNEERFQGDIPDPLSWEPERSGEFSRSDQIEAGGWTVPENRVCGVCERPPYWMDRIKAVGDSVPPQVVEVIGRAIMHIERMYSR